MRLATWSDGAAAAATDAALEALAERDDPRGAPATSGPMADSLPPAALEDGRDLMLDAVARRPGWGPHRFLLGRIERERQARLNRPTAGRSIGSFLSTSPAWPHPEWTLCMRP